MEDLRNKVAVITGGASGFGRAFALRGAALGMKLVLADINQDALDAVVAELKAAGADVIGRRTDVSQSADVQALADAAIAAYGEVNLLFNNAGVAPGGLVWERSEQDWNWALGVNLHGVLHGVRIFTPLMLAAAAKAPSYRGHIVNTASVAGLTTAPTLGPYCVAKHAVVALSESLHHDLGLVSEQVHCSVLCPGFVATGISRSDRNLPTDDDAQVAPSRAQLAAKAMLDQGIAGSAISADDVARITFDGIRDRRFYLLPHPASMEAVGQRFDDILNLRNPTGPFAQRPQIRETLMATLRGA
ncbi:SDR family oxidoreductase [Pseudomonas sp. NPDC089569]|uniref:SDR family oxidoreductase n=1 Tax=Pseudomonas sp. NPDC089569 TaxID=3390722 RepID=UPI003D03631F